MGTNLRRKIEKNDAMEEGVTEHNHIHDKADIRGDEKNIAILFFLYLLQGIPLGLCGSIPMLLQNRGVSYRQQVIYYVVKINKYILFNNIMYCNILVPN